ncbi:streptothricin N-acetyltransferase SatA, partial [Bacillus sp. SS-TM]
MDDSFIVNARLILSLSKGNRRIKYTVEDVPSYEKSYLQNQDDNEQLPYNEYINKPNQVIYIALLHN